MNLFPYTNFHELNLDWILTKMKELITEWAAMQTEFTDLEAKFQSLYDYVTSYLENLDVTPEVEAAIQKLIDDGTIASILTNSVVADTIYTHKIGSYMSAGRGTCQGFTVHNGVAYEITLYDDNLDSALLTARSLSSGNIINQASLPIGHGNGMTYARDIDKLIIIDGVINADEYYVVNPATLQVESSHVAAFDINTCVYSDATQTAYLVAFRNSAPYMYPLNADYSIGTPIVFPAIPTAMEVQSGFIVNDYLTFVSSNHFGCVYSISEKKFIKSIHMHPYTDNIWYLGEVEQWAADVNGKVYGNSCQYMGNYGNTRYGAWLIMNYEVGFFAPIEYSQMISVRTRPENFGEVYVSDTFAYLNTGTSTNPVGTVEGVNMNPALGCVMNFADNIDMLLCMRDMLIYSRGKTVSSMVCSNCNVEMSSGSVTSLTLDSATFKGQSTLTVGTLSCLSNSTFNVLSAVGSVDAQYSTINCNSAAAITNLTGSRFIGDCAIADIAQVAKRSEVYIYTNRARYVYLNADGTYYPVFKVVSYDTQLTVSNGTYTELNANGEEETATVLRVVCR